MNVVELLTPYQLDSLNQIVTNLAEASNSLRSDLSDVGLATALVAVPRIGVELKRLNDNLESGRVLLRTHTTNCVAPPREDFTVRQLEVMSKFLNNAIATGALVLPPKEDGGGQ